MARPALAFALALLAFVPGAAAAPTASWSGMTDTLLCVDGTCHIVSPPVDDARVKVGTGSFREVRLTLDGDAPLALVWNQDGKDVRTSARDWQRTGWIPAPADRVLEVTVVDLSPWVATGLRPGVGFELVAEYR